MRPVTILALVLCIALPTTANATWSFDGNAVCTAGGDQNLPVATSDGAGGAIVAWYDSRSGNQDIYVQRYDAFGRSLWAANGVGLCLIAGTQTTPRIVPDGAGGAIVAWQDYRTGLPMVFAQRVNSSGVPQWAPNGVAMRFTASNITDYRMVSDGAGGALVTWENAFFDFKAYAQRVNASGAHQWGDGIAVTTLPQAEQNPVIASDGVGGAIIAWADFRNGYREIYATRLDSAGLHVWSSTGIPIWSGIPTNAWDVGIVADGGGGAIITWGDYRNTVDSDVYAQRVNASGNIQWPVNGVPLSMATGDQSFPQIGSDGAGGAVVAWLDARNGVDWDVYAQHVDASGARQWLASGAPICAVPGNQQGVTLATDGAGGATMTWSDSRGGSADIYAQRVNASGGATWQPDGVAVSSAVGDQQSPTIVASDMGGVIVAWSDGRKGSEYDIYAQRLEPSYGTWGHPEPELHSVADVPADQGGKVRVSWFPSDHDVLNRQEITHYSVWRAVEALPATAASVSMDTPRRVNLDQVTPDFSGRAFRIEPSSAGDYFWEFVANQTAHYFPGYSYAASTSYDSIAGEPAVHTFQVVAHTWNQFVVYPSAPASGYSVDNLAPAAPLMLIAQRVGSDVQLKWNRAVAPDLRDYSVYRATSTGVTAVPGNFLSTAEDTVLVDSSAPVSPLYYIVTARDVHANQSAPSNEANVGATTGIGNTPSITTLTLLDNMPNPFASTTTLRVGLPKASEVVLDVFDVAGRRVRSERTATLAAGWRDVTFNGRDDAGQALASGVYFYRVKAAGETITRKMVITR